MAQVPALCGRGRVESSPLSPDRHSCASFTAGHRLDQSLSLTLAEPLHPCCLQLSLQHGFTCLSEKSVDTQAQFSADWGSVHSMARVVGMVREVLGALLARFNWQDYSHLHAKQKVHNQGRAGLHYGFYVSKHRHCGCPIKPMVIENGFEVWFSSL